MDKTRYLNMEDYWAQVARYCPFLLKDQQGQMVCFADYAQLYLYTMDLLYQKFQRGYVDLFLPLYDEVKLEKTECRDVLNCVYRLRPANDCMMIAFNKPGMERNNQLELVMQLLHSLTGSDFDPVAFSYALVAFDERHGFG